MCEPTPLTCALVCVGVPPGGPDPVIWLRPRCPVQHGGLEGQVQGSTQRPVEEEGGGGAGWTGQGVEELRVGWGWGGGG
jgi:hypothetical protein